MQRLLFALVLAAPALSSAATDYFPYVNKGPVILGVTQTDAWVAWYTAHHEGEASIGNTCWSDKNLHGTPNDDIPTLTLTLPGGSGATFEDATCDRYHKVHLVNLQPGTNYTFTLDKERVSGGAKAAGSFKTAPASSFGTLKFVVYGDTRDDAITSTSTRPLHQSVVDAIVGHDSDADFLLNTGDMALNTLAVSGDDNGYAEFFEVEEPLLSHHPVAIAFGNHESISTTFYDGLANAGVLSGAAHPYYFSFDWGPAHVAVLNSFEGAHSTFSGNDPAVTDAQAAWLDADLADAKSRGLKLFILSHQGAFSHGDSGAHGGGADMQSKIVPLMVKHGALTIFAGHDHYFEHGREACTTYTVVGAGGAPLYVPDMTASGLVFAFAEPSYVVVTLDATTVSAVAKDGQGNVVHSFTLEPATCEAPDAGSPPGPDAATAGEDAATVLVDGSLPAQADAGSAGLDAAPQPLDAASVVPADASGSPGADTGSGTAPTSGCGCSSGGSVSGLLVFSLVGLAGALRRRRQSGR